MEEKIMEGQNLTKEIFFPKKATRIDYFKAAVYRIITPGRIIFTECDRQQATLDNPKLKAIIKKAVPGCRSAILRLEIESNVRQHIIEDENLSIERKIELISNSIRKYVIGQGSYK